MRENTGLLLSQERHVAQFLNCLLFMLRIYEQSIRLLTSIVIRVSFSAVYHKQECELLHIPYNEPKQKNLKLFYCVDSAVEK